MSLDKLQALHDQLSNRFDTILQVRSPEHPVYFIEHGLDPDALRSLRDAVICGLQASPWLRSEWWCSRSLPLLACASELGYEYCGSGTQYWPLLEENLGRHFDFDMRAALHYHFEQAAVRWRGCQPPDNGWAETFCHIAWPITHSVLPRDLHRPFVESLRDLRVQVRNEDDDRLFAELFRKAPDSGSSRYRSWLLNREPAVSLARSLLGGPTTQTTPSLSLEIFDRIVADIRKDRASHRILRQARSQQRVTVPRTRSEKLAATARPTRPAHWASLVLRLCDNRWRLEGELPLLPVSLRKSLKQPLQGRWRPVPWGLSDAEPIPRQAILLSSPFPLGYSLLARVSSETSFLTGFEDLELSVDELAMLQSVRFRLDRPLLFGSLEDGTAHQLISHGRPECECFALVSAEESLPQLEGVSPLAKSISGAQILRVDLTNESVRVWLGLGARTESKSVREWQWLEPASLAPTAGVSRYLKADALALSIGSGDGLSIQWSRDNVRQGRLALSAGSLVTLPGEELGRYVVELLAGEERIDRREYEVIEIDPYEREHAVCSMELLGDGPSREDFTQQRLVKELLQQRLTLEIASPRRICDVMVTLRIVETGTSVGATLDALPARFGPKDPIWEQLLKSAAAAGSLEGIELTLEVCVGRLAKRSWRLESEADELWWELTSDGTPVPLSDADRYRVVSRPLDRLLADPVPDDVVSPRLLLARRKRDGYLAHFDAMYRTDSRSTWPSELEMPRRLLRQFDDSEDGTGLRRLVEVYLQVSCARTDNLVAEWMRRGHAATLRKWILTVCCGSRWEHLLEEVEHVESMDPVRMFWDQALQLRAGFPREMPESLEAASDAWFERAREDLQIRLPEGWWHGPIPRLSNTDGESLDEVFQKALGRSDYYTETESFQKALRATCWKLNGDRLADLIQPAIGGDELLEMPLFGMSVSELQRELILWRKRHLRGLPSRIAWDGDQLGSWLALLLQPSALRRHPWEDVLRSILADQPVARAGAFAVWRVEQLERLGSFRSSPLATPNPLRETHRHDHAAD